MKRVLLTGATGLIGRETLKPLIESGFEVFAVSSKEQNDTENVNWIQADLLDEHSVKTVFESVKPEYLLHLAWYATPPTYLESDLNFKWLASSLKMLEEFKNYGGKRAVFAGTCFEYEFKNEPLKETDKTNPTSTYAKCKNELRERATDYCDKSEISFGWGRIFYVYGKGEHEKRLVPFVINSLKNDKEVVISVGDLIKDYMYSKDVANAFVKFLESDARDCVNICSAKPVTIREVVLSIADKMNKTNLVKFEHKETAQPPVILGDNTRLKNEINFTPDYSLDTGLCEVLS